MKVYKVNRKQAIGTVILFVVLVTLGVLPVFLAENHPFLGGVSVGAFFMFIFSNISGVVTLNREKPPIEKIEVSQKDVKK